MAFVQDTFVLATIAAPILLLALRSAAVVAVFPPFCYFRASVGTYLILRNFRFYS